MSRKTPFFTKNKYMKQFITLTRSSILAGICIGIAGFGYLAEKSIIGASSADIKSTVAFSYK